MNKHKPIGKGFGINPGQVVWIHDLKSVNWKPENKYWWNIDNYNEEEVKKMIFSGLTYLTNTKTESSAWKKLIQFHNQKFNKKEIPEEEIKLAIKVNMNGSGEFEDDYSGNSMMDYANPVVVKYLLKSLINNTDIKPENITVFDAARIFPDYFVEYCSENELKGINFEGRNEREIDLNSPVIWSKEFTQNKSFFPKCLTKADYLINFANLKGHFWGVTLLAKNHFGTIVNSDSFMPPVYAGIHPFVLRQNYGDYSALTDLILNYQLGEKTILYGFDALVSTSTEGTNININNSKWYQTPFNDDQTKSLFFSQDPIALDSVGIDLIINEPAITNVNTAPINRDVDNYLHEAAQSQNSPSKTKYLNGNNNISKVEGVHEHWNDVSTKQYSRNLGNDEGIDLEYFKI